MKETYNGHINSETRNLEITLTPQSRLILDGTHFNLYVDMPWDGEGGIVEVLAVRGLIGNQPLKRVLDHYRKVAEDMLKQEKHSPEG